MYEKKIERLGTKLQLKIPFPRRMTRRHRKYYLNGEHSYNELLSVSQYLFDY